MQVELSRKTQSEFLKTAPTPYLAVADGWLAPDFTSIPRLPGS